MKNILRCAIYTRKSTEEGLDQAFNSLDAQREACEAYILSQKHEGWNLVPHKYDDGGFSGGNMQRPALGRLLADIRAGKVNVVVVYKVDRLTRSLSDFAKIVEQFDGQGVSFVSVTQQFNTTSSMGRLTLNVLLSFAQFEREVSGERIRDKIAASKKKGMWMGGSVPLGCAPEDKILKIVVSEAKNVRHIYDLYLKLGSVRAVQTELVKEKICSKNGAQFSRCALYQVLKNMTYIGKVKHKGHIYDGLHEAILPEELWQKVQDKLKQQGVAEYSRKSQLPQPLLTGLIYTDEGARLVPTHSNKDGRRYCYYYDAAAARDSKTEKSVMRIPAAEIERLIIERVAIYLKNDDGSKMLIAQLQSPDLAIQRKCLSQIIEKVIIHDKSVKIHIRAGNDNEQQSTPNILNISYQFQTLRAGSKVMATDEPTSEQKAQQQTLLKALLRGFIWREELLKTEGMTLAMLSKKEGIDATYITRLINLTFLAPDLITSILKGAGPNHLDVQATGHMSLSWAAQRKLLAH